MCGEEVGGEGMGGGKVKEEAWGLAAQGRDRPGVDQGGEAAAAGVAGGVRHGGRRGVAEVERGHVGGGGGVVLPCATGHSLLRAYKQI